MFGDEQFLKEHEDGFRPFSLENSQHGSAPSSHRFAMSDNPYFLATNASIFDRNPFKEFTTNKLSEVLGGKSVKELVNLKEDALKF